MPPKLDLSLKLPPRPDEPETAEYYRRQLAEAGPEFEDYESTSYAASTLAGHVDDVGLYDPHSPPQAVARAGTEKLATNDPLPAPHRPDRNPDQLAGGPFSAGTKAYLDAESIGAHSGDGAWPQTGGGWGAMVAGGGTGTSTSEASAAKPVIRGAFYMAERGNEGIETPALDPYGGFPSRTKEDGQGALPTPLRDDRRVGGVNEAKGKRGRGRRAPGRRREEEEDNASLGSVTPRSGVDEVAAMARAKNDVEEEDLAEAARKKLRNGRMTEREITDFYATAERRALMTTGLTPARLRHPKALWNGDRPALCKLTRAGKPDSAGAWECFLSRNYTEGFKKPTAFASAPPADVLCESCGDVAWDPVRDQSGGMASSRGVWCRACLCAARGDRAGETAPEHSECIAVVNALKIVCCNALAPTKTQRGDEILWRMDKAGCPDVCRLRDRRTIETNCAYAVEECCLPRGSANPGDCCRQRVRRRDMAEHRASCDHRLVKCEHPGCDRMTQARYAVSHARLCENRPFACPNRPRCEWMGTRAGVEDHLEECLHEVIPCGFVDSFKDECAGTCAVTLPRAQMLAHKEICRYQSAVCKYCGESMALRRHGQHEATCSARFYKCPNCAQTVHKLRKEQHDRTVCPGVRVECMYRSYGCDERVLKCDYARHCRERFDEHAVMVLRNDANKWARPASSAPSDEPSDPRPDEPEASNPTGKSDGFEVMVTRHELTRADLQRVDATSQRLSAGLDREIASAREEIARVEDEVYVDATARLALDMRRAREHMRALVKETDDEVQAFETKLMAETLELYNDSLAMRRKAERELAVKTSLDKFVAGYERSLREVRAELGDLTREVGESTLRLSTAISPALELKDEIERTLVEGLDGLEARIANLEWRGADRAAIAWEKTQDARENFRARCKPRVRQQMRLEEKMGLLEGRKFVTPDEDAALRAKSYVDLQKNPPPLAIAADEERDDATASGDERTITPAPGTPREISESDGISPAGI